MSSIEDRTSILKMVEERKISAEEAAQLLTALGRGDTFPKPPPAAAPVIAEKKANGKLRFLKVRVTNMQTGQRKVSVTLPLSLVRWGLHVGKHFDTEMEGINLEELSDILENEVDGKIVDVLDDEDGEHVEIYVE